MPVILLRHTRPLGVEGLCYGRSDVPLAASFATEAQALAAELPPVSAVRSSPLSRCLLLAEAVAEARGLALSVDPALAEMDFGRWERVAWDETPRAELDALAADFLHARPHGGESVAMLGARVAAALEAAPRLTPPELWVTHAGVARAAAVWAGLPAGWDTRLGYGCWMALP